MIYYFKYISRLSSIHSLHLKRSPTLLHQKFSPYLPSIVLLKNKMSDRSGNKKTTNQEYHKKNKFVKKKSSSKNDAPKNSMNSPSGTKDTGSSKNYPEYLYEKHGRTQNAKDSTPKRHQKVNDKKQKLPEINFEKYISRDECIESLKNGELMEGIIRVNPKDFNNAYITSPVVGERDIFLEGVSARNRALPGDNVAVKLLPEEEWKTVSEDIPSSTTSNDKIKTYKVKTGKVVYILEKKHPRITTGHLNIYKNNAFGFVLMSPIDSRLPRLMISLSDAPENFKKRPNDYEKTLYVATITNWNLNMAFASGKLLKSLGEAGHIEPETESILINNDIDSSPFSQEVLKCLPNGETWSISQNEINNRKDLRKECIFTIDPPTARDLDDALSCIKIDDDHYEVGVHIADVSFFIEQQSALDKEASKRATSVYLSQKVIPMLPSVLCEQLCSLNPGVDRLAYSVIWTLKKDGTVLKEWFGRTVIRSCVKLSYHHAQQMIESESVYDLEVNEFPEIDSGFNLLHIAERVKSLYGISKHLRQCRFDAGALRLDQPKLSFTLDDETGKPNGYEVYRYRDSNRMIEEFMLLANMAVAHKIYKCHPKRAILRCHPPPHAIMMEDVSQLCAQYDIPFDITNSLSISNSLKQLCEKPDGLERILPALVLMCTKPFQNAKYFCTGSVDDESVYHHYALNVPIYTHFTSPIRRYPDILVHRFLTSALDKQFKVTGDIDELQAIANVCNDKKQAAKKASEQSSELFFNVYVMECGPLIEKGVVVGILDKAVDILCVRLGIVKRVYCDKLSLYKHEHEIELHKPKLILYWRDEKKVKGKEDDAEDLNEKIAAITARLEAKWSAQKGGIDEEPVPDDAIVQILTMFSPVDVYLSVDRSTPTRLNTLLKSPFDDNTVPLHL